MHTHLGWVTSTSNREHYCAEERRKTFHRGMQLQQWGSRMLKQQVIIQGSHVMQKDGWKHTCLSPQSVVAINLHSMLIIQRQQAPHNLPKKET